jgi:hypothetical protein
LESEMAKHESTDPDIIAAEIDSRFPNRSHSGLPVHVVRARELRCRRPASRPRPVETRLLPTFTHCFPRSFTPAPAGSLIPFTPFTERSRWGASDIEGQTREGERVGTNESNRFRLEEIIRRLCQSPSSIKLRHRRFSSSVTDSHTT